MFDKADLTVSGSAGWSVILPVLGVETSSNCLPMTVRCPLCNKSNLVIYNDTKFNGSWHHCKDCNSSGDMIKLAASVWKLSVQDTVKRLLDLGLPALKESLERNSLQGYIRNKYESIDRAKAMLQTATTNLHTGVVDVSHIVQRLGFPKDYTKPYWKQRMGRFIGGIAATNAFGTFRKKSGKPNDVRGGNDRWFKGKGWKDTVVIPFEDLPGRTASLLFIGRQAEPVTDYYFHTINGSACKLIGPGFESGACMYGVMDSETACPEYDNNIFVLDDTLLALNIQWRHMRDSSLPLPMVGVYNTLIYGMYSEDARKRSIETVAYATFENRPDKQFIFCSDKVSANLFNMAGRVNGKIYITRPTLGMSCPQGKAYLASAYKGARNWMLVFEQHLKNLPTDTANRLLNSITLPKTVMKQFYTGCCEKVRELLDSRDGKPGIMRTVKVGAKAIVETEAGWFISQRDEAISDAILRIDDVIYQADNFDGDIYYSGRIIHKGFEIPFTAPAKRVEQDTGAWVMRQGLVHNKLFKIHRSWSQHMVHIAKQFHEPTLVKAHTKFGWNSDDSMFVLPNFSISYGGEVTRPPTFVIDNVAPGALFDADAPPAAIDKLLYNTPSNKFFWALAGCVAANVLAPAVGEKPVGIGVVGDTVSTYLRSAASQLGCNSIAVPPYVSNASTKIVQLLEDAISAHKWPIHVTLHPTPVVLTSWFLGKHCHNALLRMDKLQSLALSLVDNWRFISQPESFEPGVEMMMYGKHVVPLWLQHVCGNKLELPDGDSYLQRVFTDLIDVMSAYGDPGIIYEAANMITDIHSPEAQAASLVTLLHHFIEEGSMLFERGGYSNKSMKKRVKSCPCVYRVESEDHAPGIFISQKGLELVGGRRGVHIPAFEQITELLQSAHALDCACSYNGEDGWLVVESWWMKLIEQCKRSTQRRLTVVGGA